jgi:hypothetical protein
MLKLFIGTVKLYRKNEEKNIEGGMFFKIIPAENKHIANSDFRITLDGMKNNGLFYVNHDVQVDEIIVDGYNIQVTEQD